MTEKKDFWQEHSLHYLEMAFRSDRHEVIHDPDGYGTKTGDCGDTVEFYLMVKDDIIRTVSFNVNGCMNTNACANTVAHMVEGRSLEAAWEVSPEKVADFLETLPEDHYHCAELAVGAFYLSLADLRTLKQHNWKKLYR